MGKRTVTKGTVGDGGISNAQMTRVILCRRLRRLWECVGPLPTSRDVGYKYITVFDGLKKGVTVNATARMTDDCQKGIAKFLEK